MLPQIVCALLSPIPTKRKGGRFPICSLDVETHIKIKYDIKAMFHEVNLKKKAFRDSLTLLVVSNNLILSLYTSNVVFVCESKNISIIFFFHRKLNFPPLSYCASMDVFILVSLYSYYVLFLSLTRNQ